MAGTISQWQQGAFSTPVNGTVADATVVLSNDNATRTKHNSHDSDATIHVQSSTLASRPAASVAQRVWITTDGLRAYIDTGAAWNEVAYLSLAAGGTVSGPVVLSSTLAVAGLATLTGGAAIGAKITFSGTASFSAAGEIFKGVTDGLSIWCPSGASNDLRIVGSAGGTLLTIAAGTQDVTVGNSGVNTRTANFSVTVGGAAITGNSTVTGTLGVTSTVDLSGAAAGQVKFPATQNASANAQTLDDYQEGTWTPSLGGNATYTTRAGTFVKIGRLVYVAFEITVNAIGTGSSSTISGLPYTAGTATEIQGGGVSLFSSLATNVVYIVPQVGVGGTTVTFNTLAAAGATLGSATGVFGSGTRIDGYVCYYASA